jgi:hypothetical protein
VDAQRPRPEGGNADEAFAPMQPGPEQLRAGHPTTKPATSPSKTYRYLGAGVIVVVLLFLILAVL